MVVVFLKYFNQLYSLNGTTFYLNFNLRKLVHFILHYILKDILGSLQVFFYDIEFFVGYMYMYLVAQNVLLF